MRFSNAPFAVRSSLEKLLDPGRLLAGSVLVLLAAAGLAVGSRLGREASPLQSYPVPRSAIAAVHSSAPLDYAAWKEILGNLLPAESLDLFASPAFKGVLDSFGQGEAEVIIFGSQEEGHSVALLVPRQGRGESDAGLEAAAAATQAALQPLIRKVRLPDGTLSLEITQDPALFPFENTSIAGRPARILGLPENGLAYLSFGQITAIATNAKTLDSLFDHPASGLLRLCPLGGSLTIRLRAGSWPIAPKSSIRPIASPFLASFPPLLYLPNTFFTFHTQIRNLNLQICLK